MDNPLKEPLNAGEVGRPTELTEDLTLKIRKLVLDNVEYLEIMKQFNIADGTWDYWVWKNYQGFRDLLTEWKRERMVKSSEKVMESLVSADDDNIRFKASSFLLETQGKDKGYTKRIENTGLNGKDLIPTPILGNTINVSANNSDKENSEAEETNPSDTGGDISKQDDLGITSSDQPSAAEGYATGSDLDSLRELSPLEKGSDEGLPVDNGDTPILQGQALE